MKFFVWFALCLIWGTTWFFIKIGLRDLPPVSFAAARFGIALIIVFIVVSIRRIGLPKTKNEWKLVGVTGFLQFSLNYALVFWSEQHISSALAAVLQASIPAFGLLAASFHLPNERIGWRKIAAIALGFAGVATIFTEQLRSGGATTLAGFAASIVGAVAFGVTGAWTIFISRMQINDIMAFAGCAAIVFGAGAAAEASILTKAYGGGLHPLGLLFGQMLCGTPLLILFGLISEGNPLDYNWSGTAIFSVLYLAIVGTIAAFWLYYWLLGKVESSKAMTISLVTPLVAVFIGGLALDEKLSRLTFFGGLLILTSVGIVIWRGGKPTAAPVGDLTA